MKIRFALLLVLLFGFVFVGTAFAMQTEPPVTTEQIILLGSVASVVTFLLKVLVSYASFHPSRVVVNLILFAVSGFFAVQWSGAVFPPLPSDVGLLWQWLNDLMALAAPILGTAGFIYNLLYEKVIVPLTAKYIKAKA